MIISALGTLLTLVAVCAFLFFPLQDIDNLPYSVRASYQDIDIFRQNYTSEIKLSGMISTSVVDSGEIVVKALGLFPIKRIKTEIVPQRKVYRGGQVIGLVLNSDGVVVVSAGGVRTAYTDSPFKKGDIVKRVDGKDVLHTQNIAAIIKENKDKPVTVGLLRKGKPLDIKVVPSYDSVTKEYKLGAWVKDTMAGLGTVSYVRLDGRYGALGHHVVDNDTDEHFPVFSGTSFGASVVGAQKGTPGKPGSLKGTFLTGENAIVGDIQKNTKYGVFGHMYKLNDLDQIIDVGSRINVKPGKAKVVCTVNSSINEYDIEIIKAHKQKKIGEKSLVVKIVDKELLRQTGGIVQGMSGSPIIQDGKVVGALTHVFVNDPTRGYGIYADWMYDN